MRKKYCVFGFLEPPPFRILRRRPTPLKFDPSRELAGTSIANQRFLMVIRNTDKVQRTKNAREMRNIVCKGEK
jgi:hypothetical protein